MTLQRMCSWAVVVHLFAACSDEPKPAESTGWESISTASSMLSSDDTSHPSTSDATASQSVATTSAQDTFGSTVSSSSEPSSSADPTSQTSLDDSQSTSSIATTDIDSTATDWPQSSSSDGSTATQSSNSTSTSDDDSSSDVIPTTCGNAILDPFEECDDGDPFNDNACTTHCRLARCGDGYEWAFREECDDGNLDDGDECPRTCKRPSCGDGFIWRGHEDCDDGNRVDDDACPSSCLSATCGDGIVHPKLEECDRALIYDPALCTDRCTWFLRIAFVTREHFDAALGGLEGANARCQDAANAAGLPGTYKAWLSDNSHSPATTFKKSEVGYMLLNDTLIAKSYNDLTDGYLLTLLNIDEYGQVASGGISPRWPGRQFSWSATRPDGTPSTSFGSTCEQWTSSSGDTSGGHLNAANDDWSESDAIECSLKMPLRCFMQ